MLSITVGTAVAVHAAVALVADVRTRRIPNAWNLPVAAAGMAVHAAFGGWRGLAFSAIGFLLLFGCTLLLQLIHAIGGGDVKWFAALGSWTGVLFAFQSLVYTLLVAGLIAFGYFTLKGMVMPVLKRWMVAGWLAWTGKTRLWLQTAVQTADRKEMPLMVAAVPAVAMAALWHEGGGWNWLSLW